VSSWRTLELLGMALEGTLSTSVAYLVGIGVRPRSIGPMVTQHPSTRDTGLPLPSSPRSPSSAASASRLLASRAWLEASPFPADPGPGNPDAAGSCGPGKGWVYPGAPGAGREGVPSELPGPPGHRAAPLGGRPVAAAKLVGGA